MFLTWTELDPLGTIVVPLEVYNFLDILNGDYTMFDLEPQCEAKSLVGSHSPTIQSRLEQTKRELEDRLNKVNAGLTVLAKDPELASQLETLTKAIRA